MQASIICVSPKPGNRERFSRKGIQLNTLGDNGIILALVCVAAAIQLVRGGSERVPATNHQPH